MSEDIHKWTDGKYTLMFDEHTFFVWDNKKDKRMTALQVTKKLNEQQATINEYKENWDDMVELATKTSLRNVELDEQIGQLRKELNDCEKFRYQVFKRMGELNDE